MIDLGIEPIGTTLPPTTLHVDEIDMLVHLLDVDVLPVVLDAGPRFDSLPTRDAVFRRAHDRLAAAGLVDGIAVHPDLARQMRTLARPRAQIAVRKSVDGTVHRACLALDRDPADGAVLALRSGDAFTIQRSGLDLVGPLVHALGTAPALPFGVVNCPTADLAAALDRITDPRRAADQLIAVGVSAAESAVVGPAFAGSPTFTEIVGLVHEDSGATLTHGPVTVFDTAAGRVVGTTSVATDGVRWTSLSPGTPGRLRQALEALLAQLG
ncbi:ESX secretion-associated protein EspG [Prescottella agglutinans]|uniref:ESX secretion-associated protein EspG n=1 Tax=Prescottella agglutinans TaxID=1644129 RepID=A0A438B7J9_9NOCA|nr:ESX secretion-associated protein EspG [Prescottella agglutinans]RVW06934.1 ESX secretion-associated protein EspG [Prescottella agglutinans]